tara:strand:+ start:13 stop:579 length:567 start_codon:yes stop_codon:yes gene_type:complete
MAFATIDVTKGITGTIPVANGGTGLASGTTGQFLKFTGSTTLASSADNGKIGQVLRTESSSSTSLSTTTYSDIGLSQAITCSATSSKVLIMGSIMSSKSGTNTDRGHGVRILRGSTNIFTTTTLYYAYDSFQNTSFNDGDSTPFFYLDSPSSTSAITYKIQCATWNSGTVVFNSDSNQSPLVLMEVLA